VTSELKTLIGIEGFNQTKLILFPRTITTKEFISLINHHEKRTDLTHLWIDECQISGDNDLLIDYWDETAFFYFTTTDVPPEPTLLTQL
jgi:hypothetical protein